MSVNKSVTVVFNPDGTIKIEAHNFKGVGCEKATQFLEQALGTVGGRKRKPEWSQKEIAFQTQQAGR